MKILLLLILSFLSGRFCPAQSFDLKNGDQMSVSKGSLYMKVLLTEGTDVYALKSENLVKKLDDSYYLCRYDKNMTKVFEANLSKYIGDRFHYYAGALQGRIYLFSSEIKKRTFNVYGIEIDKATGSSIGNEKLICSYELPGKFAIYNYMIKPGADNDNWIVTSASDDGDDPSWHFAIINPNLQNIADIKIDLRFRAKQYFELQQVVAEKNSSIIIAGKVYDEVQGPQKQTLRPLNHYMVQRYDAKGKKLADYSLDLKGKSPMTCTVYKVPGAEKIVLGGIYCNTSKNDLADGMYFSTLDNVTLAPVQLAYKEISAADQALRKNDNVYADNSNFVMNDVLFDKQTNQLVFWAETYNFQVTKTPFWYSDRINDPKVGKPVYEQDAKAFVDKESVRPIDTYHYGCGDILLMVADLNTGNISNQYTLIKRQVEKIAENPDNNYPGFNTAFSNIPPSNYISVPALAPFYSSCVAGLYNNKLFIIYNQQKKEVEDKRKDGYPGYYTSTLSSYIIDIKSGSIQRKEITPNGDRPVFMPKLAVANGQDVFIPAMKITNKMEGSCSLTKISIKE